MRRIDWQRQAGIPPAVGAALDALRFDSEPRNWPPSDRQEWDQAIYYLHRNQLTLILRHVCGDSLPPMVRDQFDAFFDANVTRLSRLRDVTREVIARLEDAGLQPLLLKGFARAGEFVPNADARMHYDIDLLCPRTPDAAARILSDLGYTALTETESHAAGHLPPFSLPTNWKWRGDFFDPDIPIHVEIHRRLWTSEFEGFPLHGVEEFWTRGEICGDYRTLNRHDTLAHRTMHLLRHLLRGDFRAAGVYEIAWFLHQNHADNHFWTAWQSLYETDLRRAQAVCFALARRWFGCEMHPVAQTSVRLLPQSVRDWMELSAASPAQSFFAPGKQELGLHLALVDSTAAKVRIAARRLLPVSPAPRIWEGRAAYLTRLRSRAVFHVRSLVPTLFRLLMIRR